MGRWDYYTPSKPLEVKGGIKATAKGTAKNWWAKRWISTLEGFNLGTRLARGRSYARQGQVLSIDILPGTVTASVQGSRSKPYKIKLNVKTLSADEWQKILDILSGQAIFAAKLLADEMPVDIEQVFTQSGISLFPNRVKDLETSCSCPDSSNPCKHIAAVYYILGEEFDRDPFLIFTLRGMQREDLIMRLGKAPMAAIGQSGQLGKDELALMLKAESGTHGVLPIDSHAFWQGETLPTDFLGNVSPPKLLAAPLRQLGSIPFWRAQELPIVALGPVYANAVEVALGVFEGGNH